MRGTAAGLAVDKGPRNNNSPTKGLLGSSGQLSLLAQINSDGSVVDRAAYIASAVTLHLGSG